MPFGKGMIGGKGMSEDEEESGLDEDMPMKQGPSVSDMGRKKAAAAILTAIESGDAGALDKALAKHASLCSGGYESEE